MTTTTVAATSTSTSTSELVRSTSRLVRTADLQAEVLHHLDSEFHDLDILLGREDGGAGPGPSKRGKKRRTLSGDIAQWEKQESQASSEVRLPSFHALQALMDILM